MDPVTMIVSALAMGAVAAAAGVGGQALKDTYTGLRTLIVNRFGPKHEVAKTVEELEKKPESAGRKATAEEELKAAGAGKDKEIIDMAAALMEALEKNGVSKATTYVAHAEGGSGIAQGEQNTVATGGSVINTGRVKGDINTSGSSKT